MCRTGGEAFEWWLVHIVALIIMAKNNFVSLLKSFIANGLNCEARLKTNFKFVCIAMCSLVMSLT